MVARRTVALSRSAIATPREGNADAISRAFDNTRERIEAIETEVLFLGKVLDASSSAQGITQIQRQISLLTQQINVLQAQIGADASATVPGGPFSPGSFTVGTGRYAIVSRRFQLTGTQRLTLAGTSRLRIT